MNMALADPCESSLVMTELREQQHAGETPHCRLPLRRRRGRQALVCAGLVPSDCPTPGPREAEARIRAQARSWHAGGRAGLRQRETEGGRGPAALKAPIRSDGLQFRVARNLFTMEGKKEPEGLRDDETLRRAPATRGAEGARPTTTSSRDALATRGLLGALKRRRSQRRATGRDVTCPPPQR